MTINHQIRLACRPVGIPKQSDWSLMKEPIRDIADGEVLVQNYYISVDPAMRGWVKDIDSYVPPVKIGEVMRALTVGEVIKSNRDEFSEGDFIAGWDGVQEYNLSDGKMLTKVDTSIAPLHTYLNTLGIAGLTAYSGLHQIGKPDPGQTILVSGAAGSVGAHVGQLGKIHGCRVVGVAGNPDKCRYLKELGFDATVDYKSGDLSRLVAEACPDGIDVFFDNIGGEILDVGLANINQGARIVLCGRISDINAAAPGPGPQNYFALTIKRARMEGFIYMDYRDKFPEMISKMSQWIADGRITCKSDIVEGGVSLFPEVFPRLFSGENFGKLMIKV